jgi:antitoxin ParD1/3/4
MHVSLTPELEKIVKDKVASGLYNNASEVIREALRFMQTNEDLVYQMKLETLRRALADGERDLAAGHHRVIGQDDLAAFMQEVRGRGRAGKQQENP